MTETTEGKLAGQVVLITGASSGIGWEIARAFLGEGADLVVVARREQRLQALAEEAQRLGRRCAVVAGDAREEETAARAVGMATGQGVAASGMLEAEDVAAAALLMATQPARSRITEIRMRPMAEPLFGRDPAEMTDSS